MIADFHMHTFFSHDSQSGPEEMISEAVKKGLEVICITDHYDKDYMDWGEKSIFDVDAYFNTLLLLKEQYAGKIDLRIGVELGLQPHLGNCFAKLVQSYPFDFVIGSVHVINGLDPAFDELFEGHTDDEIYRLTFQETLMDIQNIRDF